MSLRSTSTTTPTERADARPGAHGEAWVIPSTTSWLSHATSATKAPESSRRRAARLRGIGLAERMSRRFSPTVSADVTLRFDHDQVGPGYGAPTEASRKATADAGRCEGVILD